MDQSEKQKPDWSKKIKEFGRPEYWTENRVATLIESLLEYANKEDSFTLLRWKAENCLTHGKVDHLKQRYPYFAEAYELAKQMIGDNLTRSAGFKVQSNVYNRCISMYDQELYSHEREIAKKDAVLSPEQDAKYTQVIESFLSQRSSALKIDNTSDPKQNKS